MNFATLVERANGAVQRHLLTDVAVLDNTEVRGSLRNFYRTAMDLIGVQDPSFELPTDQCANVEQGSHLRVPGVGSFTVQAIEPDGTGITTLRLQRMFAP